MPDVIFIETKKNIEEFSIFTLLNLSFELNPVYDTLIKTYSPLIIGRQELLFKIEYPKKAVKKKIEQNTYVFDALFIPFELPDLKEECIFTNNGNRVGVFLKKGEIKAVIDFYQYINLPEKEISGIYLDKIYNIPDLIPRFVEFIRNNDKNFREVKRGVFLKKGEIPEGVYISTEGGPVILEEIKSIEPPCTLLGPLYIGKDVHLKRCIVRNSFLKEVLRIGGEVDSSLFYGYSNKAHEGYVGHSVIGKWCNLGALTTTSDLKNTYSEIKIYTERGRINTGKIKLGIFMADHVQTGIGTLFSSGTCISSFCNLYGGVLFSGFIERFTWWGPDGKEKYNLEKAIEVAEKMMKRRGITIKKEYINLIRKMHENQKG